MDVSPQDIDYDLYQHPMILNHFDDERKGLFENLGKEVLSNTRKHILSKFLNFVVALDCADTVDERMK